VNPRTQSLLAVAALSASLVSLAISAWSLMIVREHAEQTARLAESLARFAQMPNAPSIAPALRRPPPTLDTSDE
jgi:hypothetical protein